MKKIISFLCITALLISGIYAYAQFDFSEVSDEELMSMPSQIAEEQLKRGLVKSAHLGAGSYIVGNDIPAGSYTGKNEYTYSMNFFVYDSTGYPKYNLALWNTGDETGKIELENGDKLDVNGNVELKVFTGVVWE